MDISQAFLRHYLAIYAERERGQRSSPPNLAQIPWEIVRFKLRGGAKRPSARLGGKTECLLPGPDSPSTINLLNLC